MSNRIHDFIAIGLGPFNLGLACLTDPIESLDGLFLEREAAFDWHPGLLLEDASLQTPFLADLVTLADPTSRFSFLNYLKAEGRLYNFYIRENFFLLRNEYNRYCQWVTTQLDTLCFGRHVERIDYDDDAGCYEVLARDTLSGEPQRYRCRKLVLGTGTEPMIPACCRDARDRLVHSADYLEHKAALQAKSSITLVGSGQSAAEIYLDLLEEQEAHGYTLDWVTRSPRFFPLEYGKLTLEMTSPDYIDYFHALPETTRDRLMREQKGLYKGINLDLINAIYDRLYARSLDGPVNTHLLTCAALENCHFDPAHHRFELSFSHTEQETYFDHRTEGLILATGYAPRRPEFLAPIEHRIQRDAAGRYAVGRYYSVDANAEIFVQNAELHTHGLVAPDLGMACYRNACIIRELAGREIYPVERGFTFQDFGAPDNARFTPRLESPRASA
ncbi:lysine N(6)-hydroxylase/L-ornithine N(5)-oxygenase family protein [Salinicola avicenniae]|uniref:lysine N(6)-hydroxylase/L-ornithine N(5)-oxygenase family protein n=1 Tax=Salinicola avicenniae TaxID=2916836 RepID=UPI002074184E|nr:MULTISPECIES: SidA/IucD/PvdA family monooxygenase [unclassified Salinicola]